MKNYYKITYEEDGSILGWYLYDHGDGDLLWDFDELEESDLDKLTKEETRTTEELEQVQLESWALTVWGFDNRDEVKFALNNQHFTFVNK